MLERKHRKTNGFITFWNETQSKTNDSLNSLAVRVPHNSSRRVLVRQTPNPWPELVLRPFFQKKHWFYCENIFKRANTIIKPMFFWKKRVVKPIRATDSGPGFHILVWIGYEEPLQPSCLGKIENQHVWPQDDSEIELKSIQDRSKMLFCCS